MEADGEEKRTHVSEMGQESLAIDVPLGHMPFQEDEMLSWLQYPLDDSPFSKSYCLEQNCDPPFTSFPSQNLFQGLPSEKPSLVASFSPPQQQLIEKSDSSIDVQLVTTTTDAAMALGAQRAAGILPQPGAEVFHRVHTSGKSCNEASNSKAANITHTSNNVEVTCPTAEHAGKRNTMNFPFFSQRIASMKSSLQILGASGGPSIKDRLRQPSSGQSNGQSNEISSSTVEQSTAGLTGLSDPEASDLNGLKQANQITAQKTCDAVRCGDKTGQAEVELNANAAAIGTEIFETGDVTLTSLSGGSDYSTGKSAKDANCKSKLCPAEEFECESKDTGGIASQVVEPVTARSRSVKRTRAAEIHNQSERRRRNKINEKMRALQELIPNANKTDKASMLDEAIEYVKMLQAQLQLMSMRTGMIVPPVMMPPGMQYLSLQQRSTTPHTSMGMGALSRGLGSQGAMDTSTSSVSALTRPVFLGQPLPGHVYHHVTGYPSHGSPASIVHDLQSHLHIKPMYNSPAFQQLQPSRLQRTGEMPKANSDPEKKQQQQQQE